MKFATGLLTLTLAYSAFANPVDIKKRALADYQNIFTGISDQVATVGETVASYVSGSANADAVQTASNELTSTINDGATAIPGFDPLSNADALALVSPSQDLTSDVSGLVDRTGETPLMGTKSPRCMKLLLAHPGIEVDLVDDFGWSALGYSAYGGHLGCAHVLLRHGARPDLVDLDGFTPRDRAEQAKQWEMVKLLEGAIGQK
ncbi:ankyrin repeat-containing domain protein [Aspergillus spectabilis]